MILIAPNYLKGSLAATKAAEAIKEGILKNYKQKELILCPIADGGDGTLDAIKWNSPCIQMENIVTGPLGIPVKAQWLILEDKNHKIAIIEAAQANGIALLQPNEYNPLKSTSYGVGELILQALYHQCTKIILTIGGSATNDGGVGLLQALGIDFLDIYNNSIGFGGGSLKYLHHIHMPSIKSLFSRTSLIVACDVDNPLCGPRGASLVYAPQKGASADAVLLLERNLTHFADCSAKVLGKDDRELPGVGAAGGIGFALISYLDAQMVSGFDLIASLLGLEEKIKKAKLVITTEGRFDSQSLNGKATYKIASLAAQYNIPTLVFAGSVETGCTIPGNLQLSLFSLMEENTSLEYAMHHAYDLLFHKVASIIPNYL